jgi:3-hydroxymyristoyl/3-hydroxydecanoyl-(acyl carrier protein) dehydratase
VLPRTAIDEHFRAFSFVDRIHAIQPGVRIRGCYTIPAGIPTFHTSLVAEAVGQLAAWAAMAAVDFKSRPVAGLAANIDLLAPVLPGQVLELAAELETVDAEAVAYDGTAYVDGSPVIRLQHCVGPMLPLEDFDDPQLLRERFALLQAAGAVPGAFGGLPSFALDPTDGEAGRSLRATLHVPTSAPFFYDHFPRRPVFPGSLLMESKLELAAALAMRLPPPSRGGRWALHGIADVKLRAFTPPGEKLELEARLNQLSTNAASLNVETRKDKRVISGARVLFAPEVRS